MLSASNQPPWIKGALLSLALVAVFFLGFGLHMVLTGNASPADGTGKHGADHASGSKAGAKWTCSMHPQIRQDGPGKCPICGMALVPVASTASASGMREISIGPDVKELLKIRAVPVKREFVTATVRMVGKIAFDETRLAYISAWVAGRLEKLFVDYTGIQVRRGDHMVSIYSPDLYTAEAELIQALRFARERKEAEPYGGLVAAAREKLRLLGVKPEQIAEIEQKGTPADRLTIYAPTGGIVVRKYRSEGDYVKVGDRIYGIADLSRVWVLLDAYESDLPWIRYGQEVAFTTEAFPGERFVGRIAFIDPVVDDKTRTVKVRVNVDNASGKLKPDMFVHGLVEARVAEGGKVVDPHLAGKWISPMHPEIVREGPGRCPVCGMQLVRAEDLGFVTITEDQRVRPLVIPRSAALVTGTRAVVYVEMPGRKLPTYQGREIVLGPRAGDYYLVRSGLEEKERVVVSGNFKLDSAVQIQAKPSMMTPEGGGGGGHDHGGHGGKKAADPGEMKQAMAPPEFHQALAKLVSAQADIRSALEKESLDPVQGSFQAFGKVLVAMQGDKLAGHARMLWNELAMLLRNDAVVGAGAKDLAEARKAFGLLSERMHRLGTAFGNAGHGSPTGPDLGPIPPGFRLALGGLVKAYLPLQKALAADDPAGAHQAVAGLKSALDKADPKELSDPARKRWDSERKHLERILLDLGTKKELKGQREAFAPLSGTLAALVRTFGVEAAGPVFQLRCSMAFDNRGGAWLQLDDQPRNPYFGAAMPACADRIERLTAPAPKGEEHRHD